MNCSQARHAANSVRAIGMAQFAAYGYNSLSTADTDLNVLMASIGGYVISEILAYRFLERCSDGQV